jgi:hypothetical protein
MQGKGRYVFDDGSVYAGDFVDGYFHGFGVLKWNDGDVYEGDFVKDHRTGTGIMKWSDGDVYEGEFENGVFMKGTITYSDGTKRYK